MILTFPTGGKSVEIAHFNKQVYEQKSPVNGDTLPQLLPEAKTVTVQPTPQGDVEQIVRAAARKYGIDENHFAKIARCESGFNPSAVNYNYYENGNPSGLFQHISGYWPGRAAKYGWSGASVFNAQANAEVTAQMFRDGQQKLWECR